jgi:glutamate dehydrogenase
MLRFKLYHLGGAVALSDSLPMLEHMGLEVLDERPHRITPEGMEPIWMHDLGMLAPTTDAEVEIDSLHEVFEAAFGQIFRGDVENDEFNRLVIAARLPAQEIVILRACAKYLRQIGFPLSQAFIQATLAAHADIARQLVELFKVRFDPAGEAGAGARAAEQVRAIEGALDAPVSGADSGHHTNELLAPRRRREAAQFRVVQVRSGQGSGLARTEADVRDLRVLDAL